MLSVLSQKECFIFQDESNHKHVHFSFHTFFNQCKQTSHSFSSSNTSFLYRHSGFQKKSVQRTRTQNALNLASFTKVFFDLTKQKGKITYSLGKGVVFVESISSHTLFSCLMWYFFRMLRKIKELVQTIVSLQSFKKIVQQKGETELSSTKGKW